MFVPVCDRPSVAEPTGAQDALLWRQKALQFTGKCRSSPRQLPITGFAHKAGNGRRPLPAATGIARSVRARRRGTGWQRAKPSCCRCRYFHVVFTLPAAIGRHRLPEQGGDLRSAVHGRRRDAAHHRGRSQASRRPHRHHRRAAHLGLGHDPPSACPHDRAGRRHLARRQALDRVPARLPPARAGALAAVPAAVPGRSSPTPMRPGDLQFFGDQHGLSDRASLRRRTWRRCAGRTGSSTPSHPFAGPEAVLAYLAALHPPRRDLQLAA